MKKELLYTLAILFATVQTFAQTYTYDSNYRLTKVLYGNGVTVNYTYDALGNRLTKKVTGASAQTFTITTTVTPVGSGTVTGGGTYNNGTTVELNAIPNAGYEFSRWSDGVTDNPRSFTVTSELELTAHFTKVSVSLLGDVNMDGTVNITDVSRIVEYVLGRSPSNFNSANADLNGDGTINITDVIMVVKIILGETPTDIPAEPIDLGLPSGTKWASCNVGATKPEEYGGYYAWGETEEKSTYDWSTYIHCDGSEETWHDIGFDISDTEYDVAHVRWGGKWCMPTYDEIKELLDNCTAQWTSLNGVNGTKFTSKFNGNSIFLPAAGGRWDKGLNRAGRQGNYWMSTKMFPDLPSARYLSIYDYWDTNGTSCSGPFVGFSVRPVIRSFSIPDPITILVEDQATVKIPIHLRGCNTIDSDNESVATARIYDNTSLIIKGISEGTATISVTDTRNGRSCSFNVRVIKVVKSKIVAEFIDDIIKLDFGFETNIGELVKTTGKRRLMYPTNCVTVKVNGEVKSCFSVEGCDDGRFYVFLQEGTDDDNLVEVTFTNPTDPAFHLTYTSGPGGDVPNFSGHADNNSEILYHPKDDVIPYHYLIPAIVKADPEDGAFNLPNSIKEFKVTFDKLADAAALEVYLNNERLQVSPSSGLAEDFTFTRTSAGDLATDTYELRITKIYPGMRLDDDIYGETIYIINVGE